MHGHLEETWSRSMVSSAMKRNVCHVWCSLALSCCLKLLFSSLAICIRWGISYYSLPAWMEYLLVWTSELVFHAILWDVAILGNNNSQGIAKPRTNYDKWSHTGISIWGWGLLVHVWFKSMADTCWQAYSLASLMIRALRFGDKIAEINLRQNWNIKLVSLREQ